MPCATRFICLLILRIYSSKPAEERIVYLTISCMSHSNTQVVERNRGRAGPSHLVGQGRVCSIALPRCVYPRMKSAQPRLSWPKRIGRESRSRNIQTAMSTKKDATLQSDITKFKHEPDGSFKRAPSTFRSFIEKGGQFEAEKGEYYTMFCC